MIAHDRLTWINRPSRMWWTRWRSSWRGNARPSEGPADWRVTC